jgi:hypothetical protein
MASIGVHFKMSCHNMYSWIHRTPMPLVITHSIPPTHNKEGARC